MAYAAHVADRNKVFQELKPCCVRISQLAIRDPEAAATHRELLELTRQVLDILDDQVHRNPDALDEKLAEYVFFPLYHIFRQLDLFPMLLIENAVRCLNVLIVYGWKTKMPPKMVLQLLTLLVFIIDGVPGSDARRDVPEEAYLESFRALTALFTTVGSSATVATGLADPDTLPALGHGITVMLEGVVNGASEPIQQEALRSVQAVYSPLVDQAALANFLPGTMTSLAKVLTTPKHYKRAYLARCLNTMGAILTRVLGDMQTRSIQARAQTGVGGGDKTKLLTPAWLTATTGQVKLLLSSVMKLRTHESSEVRTALRELCVKLLDECHTTLVDCAPFLVETAMVLDEGSAATPSITATSLRELTSIYPELAEKAKSAVYNWLSTLPRVLQSSDVDIKRNALHNLSKGLALLHELGIESATLEDTLSSALRDSTVALMTSNKSRPMVATTDVISVRGDGTMGLAVGETRYPPVLLDHESQREIRTEMANLLGAIGSTSEAPKLAMNMLEHVRTPGSENQVAAMWLCLELVVAAQNSSADETDLLDMSEFTDSAEDIDVVFQELYSFSVELLDSHTDTEASDWRLEALALEVTSQAATRSGESFRPELIDVLFPIVTFLGSSNHSLRQHAIISLNEIASACAYDSVSGLIIDNVDYMVNSVALHLNTLDISPASTQVLTMMIRLAGPRLVPFLDDVVDSVFGALDNYHGYPVFVESLFAVLKELVDQAVKSDILLLEDQKKSVPDHKKVRPQPEGIDGLLKFISRRRTRQSYKDKEAKTREAVQGHPTASWKDESVGNDAGRQDNEPPPEPEKPPNSVTYQLLLRIARLTQHYLTSPTPRLRRSLLDLLSTASPALAADEEAFLPLINDVWPVVTSRLYDSETFIAVEACRTLSEMCSAAGDFLASRFKTEWADGGMGAWCRKVKRQVLSGNPGYTQERTTRGVLGSGGGSSNILIPTANGGVEAVMDRSLVRSTEPGSLGQHSSPVRLWEAVVRLLTALVANVRISDDMFEDILDILSEVLEKSSEVREVLETINPDAVWLARYERGCVEILPTPKMEGVVFVPMQGPA